jgi:hypothetical protein
VVLERNVSHIYCLFAQNQQMQYDKSKKWSSLQLNATMATSSSIHKFLLTILLIFNLLNQVSSQQNEFCTQFEASSSVAQTANWANLQLKEQDEQRLEEHWISNHQPQQQQTLSELRNFYYKMASNHLQTGCNVIKRIAGRWLPTCGFLDGEKLLCMDGLYDDVQSGNCLVYSFGLCK